MVDWEGIGSAFFDKMSEGMKDIHTTKIKVNDELRQFRMKEKLQEQRIKLESAEKIALQKIKDRKA